VTQTSTASATQDYLTTGGAFSNSGSAYGTFDQAGDVYELNDAVLGSSRGVRGGTWWANNSGATLQLSKNGRSQTVPTAENSVYGFRLAASAAPRIAVEQPAGSSLTNGTATVSFGAVPSGASSSRVFTIRNTGTSPLTGLYLHLASNNTNNTPFNIALAADAISPTADADGDGLNDWAEYQMAPLGFDWEVSQPSLVGALSTGANAACLYNLSQIQSLNINTPLLSRDAGGNVKLTIGLQKATNLGSEFGPLPFHLPQMTVNPEGQLEFSFSPEDNAAFFRLESR
jgi:hypothetical protein